jgi:hypothetical protein
VWRCVPVEMGASPVQAERSLAAFSPPQAKASQPAPAAAPESQYKH